MEVYTILFFMLQIFYRPVVCQEVSVPTYAVYIIGITMLVMFLAVVALSFIIYRLNNKKIITISRFNVHDKHISLAQYERKYSNRTISISKDVSKSTAIVTQGSVLADDLTEIQEAKVKRAISKENDETDNVSEELIQKLLKTSKLPTDHERMKQLCYDVLTRNNLKESKSMSELLDLQSISNNIKDVGSVVLLSKSTPELDMHEMLQSHRSIKKVSGNQLQSSATDSVIMIKESVMKTADSITDVDKEIIKKETGQNCDHPNYKVEIVNECKETTRDEGLKTTHLPIKKIPGGNQLHSKAVHDEIMAKFKQNHSKPIGNVTNLSKSEMQNEIKQNEIQPSNNISMCVFKSDIKSSDVDEKMAPAPPNINLPACNQLHSKAIHDEIIVNFKQVNLESTAIQPNFGKSEEINLTDNEPNDNIQIVDEGEIKSKAIHEEIIAKLKQGVIGPNKKFRYLFQEPLREEGSENTNQDDTKTKTNQSNEDSNEKIAILVKVKEQLKHEEDTTSE